MLFDPDNSVRCRRKRRMKRIFTVALAVTATVAGISVTFPRHTLLKQGKGHGNNSGHGHGHGYGE
jgi:hypothetical protein